MRALWILIFAVTSMVAQPNIGGIVNSYAVVQQIRPSKNQLLVSDASAFTPGDAVLIIQMQGASVDTTVGPSYGTLRAYDNAGRFERNIVARVDGAVVTLRNRLSQSYSTSGSVQLITLPRFTSARVTTALRCRPWDGATGGVLALAVRDTLYIDADVDVSGCGFRGGNGSAYLQFSSDAGSWASNDTVTHVERGEGIAVSPYLRGCAHMTNGAGGGATEVHGGGGGAHAGCGGDGADVKAWWGNHAFGRGGTQLSYTTGYNRIFMGGGGGAAPRRTSTQDTSEPFPRGGIGGGIAIIDAPVIVGANGAAIKANGMNGVGSRAAGSGGGAGGALLITATRLVNVPELQAKGGDGGTPLPYAMQLCQGPGGGGGGGAILLGTLNPLNLNPSAYAGGSAGVSLRDTCMNVRASSGCFGTIVYNARINEDTTAFRQPTLRICADTSICPGTSATLTGSGTVRLQWWSNGQQLCNACDTVVVTPDKTTLYVAVAAYADGSADTASMIVTVYPRPRIALQDPPAFCPGDSVVLTAPLGFASYAWSTGDTASSIVVRMPGTYSVTVTDGNGCTAMASAVARYQSLTVITVDAVTSGPGSIDVGTASVGERVCSSIDVRSVADTNVIVHRALLQRGIELSVPLGQFPIILGPRQQQAIAICAMANYPAEYADTIHLLSGCGVFDVPVHTRMTETPAYTRCAVRVTNPGEVEQLLPPQLVIGVYRVRVETQRPITMQWTISTLCGQLVQSGSRSDVNDGVMEIDVSGLASSAYTVSLQWEGGRAAGILLTP